jgi:putative RecB family exonuclease
MKPVLIAACQNSSMVDSPRSGSVFDYISASRLSLWLKCPLAFRLKYIDGIQFRTPPAVFLGKRVHAGIEWYYRHRQFDVPVTSDDVSGFLRDEWGESVAAEGMQFESADDEAQLQTKAGELVRVYLTKVASETARPIAVETAVEAPLVDSRSGEDLGIPLVGVMDLVLGEDSGPVIVDFKTAARADQLSELSHEVQLGCYAYLFRQTTGTTESALEIRRLVKTKKPQVSFHRWPARTGNHFGRLFAVIRAYLDDLHSQRFVFRPSQACSYCDFRERHCREWAG